MFERDPSEAVEEDSFASLSFSRRSISSPRGGRDDKVEGVIECCLELIIHDPYPPPPGGLHVEIGDKTDVAWLLGWRLLLFIEVILKAYCRV
jgi:hypothetical protein